MAGKLPGSMSWKRQENPAFGNSQLPRLQLDLDGFLQVSHQTPPCSSLLTASCFGFNSTSQEQSDTKHCHLHSNARQNLTTSQPLSLSSAEPHVKLVRLMVGWERLQPQHVAVCSPCSLRCPCVTVPVGEPAQVPVLPQTCSGLEQVAWSLPASACSCCTVGLALESLLRPPDLSKVTLGCSLVSPGSNEPVGVVSKDSRSTTDLDNFSYLLMDGPKKANLTLW